MNSLKCCGAVCVCKHHTRNVFVALPKVWEPAAAEDPVSMRGSLCDQPHCCGDQPQSISVCKIHHSSREHEAFMDTTTMKRPLQVTQT